MPQKHLHNIQGQKKNVCHFYLATNSAHILEGLCNIVYSVYNVLCAPIPITK